MKKGLFFLITFLTFTALAQPYAGSSGKLKPLTTISKAAGCIPPSTTTLLELNNVRAMIHTAGNLWQIPAQNYSQYEVPKNSGIMCLFTAALWLGGTDVNNQLKLAALRYREGQDYWTGPLSIGAAEATVDDCFKYDKHFVSAKDQVTEFNAWYETGILDQQNGTSNQASLFPNYIVPKIIKEWPAHGDVSKGQDYYLAPFFDYNNDGKYDYKDGDYPWYDITNSKNCKADRRVSLYGDQNFWWIMNDKGNLHTETTADPIGMEIRAQAFAFTSGDEINNMTFYNYELINRGTQTLFNTYFGFFTDGALGNPTDDYVGCDVNRGLGYYYNGNSYDATYSGYKGYGENPPAVGVDFFEGPYQDIDSIDNAFGIGTGEALNGIGYGDGIIDNERYGMRRFLYYSNTTNGANPNQTDPIAAYDYYNYLRGHWKDGTPFVYGGSGHVSDPDANPNIQCDFMFPGDTDPLGWGTGGQPQPLWTEETAGNVPNDRRFLESAGPFILKPGAVNNITVGVAWARAVSGDPFESVKVLQVADDKAQALFENCFKVLEGPHAPDLSFQELENKVVLYLNNPIGSNNYNEKYIETDPFIISSIPNIDKNYRFQGYQIYQLKSSSVSISDLENSDKARLVAQCDIEDDFQRIINFEFDENLDACIPVEKVKGENKGIKHSFLINDDMFASGTKTLVNFKTYYYMAVSYAVNNYKTYNPNDPLAIDGQKKIYIKSRKAAYGQVKVMTVTPHNPKPEQEGTYQNSNYGDSPEVTRLDGFGNGDNAIDLTEKSKNDILKNGFITNPTYQLNHAPIGIKVIDPLNVVDGYFECTFKDYTASSTNSTDTARWTIYRYSNNYDTKQLLDSVTSTQTIENVNEQLIPKWGVSVYIYQKKYKTINNQKFANPIESTIEFDDSTKRWLSFVPDNETYYPSNWIRSGSYGAPNSDSNEILKWRNPWCYKDELNIDPFKVYSKIVDGGFAPHRITGFQCDYMPLAYFNMPTSGAIPIPSYSRTNASISYLPSVDIVFTTDKSKWTRCPVIEIGRDPNLTLGGAKAGAMRKSPSVDKNGIPFGQSNCNTEEAALVSTSGMGWFPGYAIDVESGARLFMAFGENSFLSADNGSDMQWNPTSKMMDNNGEPIIGGGHSIYIFSYKLPSINNLIGISDLNEYQESNNEIFNLLTAIETTNSSTDKRNLYSNLTWIGNPILAPNQKLLTSNVVIRIRIHKEYKNYLATGKNNGKPMYSWNMSGNKVLTRDKSALIEALKLINVVPNPYYGYSGYERSKIDSRVKIINLPTKCNVNIYNVNGKLVRSFKKDNEISFIEWDLNNSIGIQLSSGVYLIHVEVPGAGERVVKFFAGMRQVDLENF
ncbi:MAG: T9SS type A sorting domain-containing protein [Flavobacteriia bacterium]|nr:T9SS type A sorting domain-containing protein [Flavobacteriia bacterium]